MEKKHVFDKRTVKLEDILKEGYIPFLAGRPERKTVIGDEDMVNLAIALNASRTLEEFLLHV